MKRFALAVCLLAITAQTLGQGVPGGGPGGPGGGGPGIGPGGGPGIGPGTPVLEPHMIPQGPGGQPDPFRKENCPRFWTEENGSCYM